jgi:hypothetical protein
MYRQLLSRLKHCQRAPFSGKFFAAFVSRPPSPPLAPATGNAPAPAALLSSLSSRFVLPGFDSMLSPVCSLLR